MILQQGVLVAMKEVLGQGVVAQLLSVPVGNLTFDQPKELLFLQLSHDREIIS